MVATIPAERLMLETDCPWCEIRPSHAGFAAVATRWPSVKKERWEPGCRVKNRVEPEHIWQVLEVVAHARGEDKVCPHAYACVRTGCCGLACCVDGTSHQPMPRTQAELARTVLANSCRVFFPGVAR